MKLFSQPVDLYLRRQVCEEQDGHAAGSILRDFRAHEVARVRSRPTMTTSAPCSASSSAAASPRPLVAPVMRTVFPLIGIPFTCDSTLNTFTPSERHFNFRKRSTLSAAPPRARARLSFATLCANTLLI